MSRALVLKAILSDKITPTMYPNGDQDPNDEVHDLIAKWSMYAKYDAILDVLLAIPDRWRQLFFLRAVSTGAYEDGCREGEGGDYEDDVIAGFLSDAAHKIMEGPHAEAIARTVNDMLRLESRKHRNTYKRK